MYFIWDFAKGEANQHKHGVGFDEAQTVFGDPLSVTIPDDRHSLLEERFVILGRSRAQTAKSGQSAASL